MVKQRKNSVKVGQKYNRLTILEFSHTSNKNGYNYYKCICDCGNIVIKKGVDIKRGNVGSCGCYRDEKLKEYIENNSLKCGDKYNRLTVIEYDSTVNRRKYYKCKCECGNEVIVNSSHIRMGNIKSCGCLQKENIGKYNSKRSVKIGQKYNRLTVVEFSHIDNNNSKWYKCICECGNTAIVKGSYIKNGITKSCGCAKIDAVREWGKKHRGENSPMWKGGISYEPYCVLFNDEFKERVRNFFGRICVECGKTEEDNCERMSVHHVNFDKETCCNDEKPLFVTLCKSCHAKTNYNREYWEEKYTTLINEKYGGQCYLPKSF